MDKLRQEENQWKQTEQPELGAAGKSHRWVVRITAI
jgi:hypothetical protein